MGLYFNPGGDVEFNKKIAKRRIGKRLKTLRKSNGEILDNVAGYLGVSRSQISKIENGKNELDASMVAILAEKYNTTAESFYNLKGYVVDHLIYTLLSQEVDDSLSVEKCMKYMDYRFNEITRKGRGRQLLDMMLLSFELCEKYDNPRNKVREINEYSDEIDKMFYDANKWCKENGVID